jgi:hypothetical protein
VMLSHGKPKTSDFESQGVSAQAPQEERFD